MFVDFRVVRLAQCLILLPLPSMLNIDTARSFILSCCLLPPFFWSVQNHAVCQADAKIRGCTCTTSCIDQCRRLQMPLEQGPGPQ